MMVFGRLGALFVVLGGAALLLVDSLRSPLGLWYAVTGIVAGTTMMAYTVISSPSPRRLQPAPEPTYSSTSSESTTASTTQQTDSQPVNTPQTAKSTESTDQEPEPASDVTDPSEPPTSVEKLNLSSTTVKRLQYLPKKIQSTQRTGSYTNSSQSRKTAGASTRRNRPLPSTASPSRSSPTGTDNQYFKPVDSSREVKFVQIDTRFSYLDVDWGPEFISLDPVPDLIEIDVGPSAVSHELVRSPIEIKISSFLKDLLAPTPHSSCTAASNDSERPSTAADNHARQRTDDTATIRKSAPRDTYETRYSDQDRRVNRRHESLTATNRRQHPAEADPRSGSELENHRPTAVDTSGYGGREEMDTFDGVRSSNRCSLGWEPVMGEEPIGLQDVGVAKEPAVDGELNHSPPRWEPPQWDADPFGLRDVDPGFSELEESVVEPVEQPELGLGMSDWEAGVSIEDPVVDAETCAEMVGLGEFTEPPESAVGLPGPDVETGSNPLLPDAESFFPEEDEKDNWLTF